MEQRFLTIYKDGSYEWTAWMLSYRYAVDDQWVYVTEHSEWIKFTHFNASVESTSLEELPPKIRTIALLLI